MQYTFKQVANTAEFGSGLWRPEERSVFIGNEYMDAPGCSDVCEGFLSFLELCGYSKETIEYFMLESLEVLTGKEHVTKEEIDSETAYLYGERCEDNQSTPESGPETSVDEKPSEGTSFEERRVLMPEMRGEAEQGEGEGDSDMRSPSFPGEVGTDA